MKNKGDFLEELHAQLSCLDKEDIQEIIEEYRLLIEEKLSLGQSEEEILQAMDHPEDIAKGYIIELLGEDIYTDLQFKKEKKRSEKKRLDEEKNRIEELLQLQQLQREEELHQKQIQAEKQNKESKNLALFIVLQIFHIFFLLPIFIGLIATLFGVGFSGLALIIAATTSALLPIGLGLKIVVGLIIISIGLLLLNVTIALSIFVYKITKRYVLWNIRLIQ